MPTKQEIEAEFNASEKETAVANVNRVIAEFEEFEAKLWEAEKNVWQPHWSRDDPMGERILRSGKSSEEIEKYQAWANTIWHVMRCATLNKPLPPEIEKELNDRKAASNLALQQLAAIVAARK